MTSDLDIYRSAHELIDRNLGPPWAARGHRRGRAGSGISVLEGSSLLVDDATINEIELAVETVRRQGEVSATRLEQQAVLARFQGSAARTAGFFGAGTTLLKSFAPPRDSLRTALTRAGVKFN